MEALQQGDIHSYQGQLNQACPQSHPEDKFHPVLVNPRNDETLITISVKVLAYPDSQS